MPFPEDCDFALDRSSIECEAEACVGG